MERYKFSQIHEKASKVSRVIYRNSNIELPFDLGKLDFFVDPEGRFKLETHNQHHRAAWLSKIAIADKQGNIYFYPTIKGIGFLYPENYESKKDEYQGRESLDITVQKSSEDPWGYKVLGLFDRRNLNQLIGNVAELKKNGLRCEEIAGAIELKDVLMKGKSIGIPELRQYLIQEAKDQNLSQKIIDDIKGFEPVIVIRLLRENTRIKDFCEASRGKKIEILSNVFNLLNFEKEKNKQKNFYDINNPKSIEMYLKDFFSQAGKSLAIMQNCGAMMSYFNSGNITLSLGEVADLDSIVFLDKGFSAHITPDLETGIPKGYKKDIRDQIYAIGLMFLRGFSDLIKIDDGLRESLCAKFMESYEDAINNQKLKEKKLKPKQIKETVSFFANKMIRKNERIAPVKLM